MTDEEFKIWGQIIDAQIELQEMEADFLQLKKASDSPSVLRNAKAKIREMADALAQLRSKVAVKPRMEI